MNMEANCFKVVTMLNRKKWSYMNNLSDMCGTIDGKRVCLGVEYHKNKAVYPPVGKLMVFDTIDHAQVATLVGFHDNLQLWTAYGTDLVKAKTIQCVSYFTFESIVNFWRGDKVPYMYLIDKAPVGTYLATSVTLLERLLDMPKPS
jgi:hypothetical protein